MAATRWGTVAHLTWQPQLQQTRGDEADGSAAGHEIKKEPVLREVEQC